MRILTSRTIIAHRKIRGHTRPRILQSIRTVLCRTADLSRVGPHDLAVMAPFGEGGQVWVVVAVGLRVVVDLAVVHCVGDHEGDLAWGVARADVLAVAAAVCGSGVVC